MEADLDPYPRQLTNGPISPRSYGNMRNNMVSTQPSQPRQPTVLLPRIIRPVPSHAANMTSFPNVSNLPRVHNLPQLPRIVPIISNRNTTVPITRPTTPVPISPVRAVPISPVRAVPISPVRNPNVLSLSSTSSLPVNPDRTRPVMAVPARPLSPVTPRRGLVGTMVPVRSTTFVPVVTVPLSPRRGNPLSPNIDRTSNGSYQ